MTTIIPQFSQTPVAVTLEGFAAAVMRGISAFEEAGRILVHLVDADAGAASDIIDKNPGFTRDMLAMFERIGRGQLYYKLTINETPGVKALRRCPYSEQVAYFDKPLPLLLMDDCETDELLVSVHALTKDQARQVIGPKRWRVTFELSVTTSKVVA